MGAWVDDSHESGEQRLGGAGRHAGVVIGRPALLVDPVVVEQQPGILGDEARTADRLPGCERRRVGALDLHAAGGGTAQPDEGTEERRLPRPVASHQREDLTGADVEVDLAQRGDRAEPHVQPSHAGDDVAGRPRRGRRGPVPQPLAQRTRRAAGVADRQREPVPPLLTAELHEGRHHGRIAQHHRRDAVDGSPALAGDEDHPVGVLHHPFEAVLGHQHRDAEVVHQPREDGEHLLGRRRVERRGRLVEHEHPRARREHRADRHPLRLPSRERRQGTRADLVEAEQVEDVLDAPTHHGGRDPEVLHDVRELVLDDVGDEARRRVLPDDPDDVGELAGREHRGVPAIDTDPTAQGAAGEAGHQPVDGLEQGRLARPGAADDEAQLPLGDREIDPRKGRHLVVGVHEGDLVEADHAGTACAAARTVAAAGSGGSGVSHAGAAPHSRPSAAEQRELPARSAATP